MSSRHLFPVVIVQVLLVFWPGSFFLGFHPVRSGICPVVAMLQEYIGAPERRKLHGSAAGCSLSDSDRCEDRY